MQLFLCLSWHSVLCMSVFWSHGWPGKNTRSNFTNFSCLLHVAMARSSAGNAMHQFTSGLWMTSRFHIIGHMAHHCLYSKQRGIAWQSKLLYWFNQILLSDKIKVLNVLCTPLSVMGQCTKGIFDRSEFKVTCNISPTISGQLLVVIVIDYLLVIYEPHDIWPTVYLHHWQWWDQVC